MKTLLLTHVDRGNHTPFRTGKHHPNLAQHVQHGKHILQNQHHKAELDYSFLTI